MSQLPPGDRVVKFLYDHFVLIIVLIIGLAVWSTVFNLAIIDYMASDFWRARGVWLGTGDFDLFGYTMAYQFEGYTDYSFYYVHWGTNTLRGVIPYDSDFGYIVLDGFTNENGAYMFPPFSAYLYAAGIAIPVDTWGIGLIITVFGYLTALPVYGLGKSLTKNQHIGEAAALTYLLNPSVLYHTVFVWLNPAPFIFFFFTGFYMLVRGKKHTGTILIVCAALFKQTAWFLGIPLVVYLLVRPSSKEETNETPTSDHDDSGNSTSTADSEVVISEPKKGLSDFITSITNFIDIKGFLVSTVLVLCFVFAIMLPFVVMTPEFIRNLLLAAGGFPLESFTELPGYGSPMRLQVLPVAAGLPEVAQILDFIVYYGFLLSFSAILFMGIMFIERREVDRPLYYMRRLLFLTMLLMLCVHLLGPRGVYKYYFTLFAPFFSIFASTKMVSGKEESVSFSFSMLWLPILLSLSILIPAREIYLFCVLLIFLGFLFAPQIGMFWSALTAPIRWLKDILQSKFSRVINRLETLRESKGPNQRRVFTFGENELVIEYVGALDQIFTQEKVLHSKLYYNKQMVSENRIRTWCEEQEPLSGLDHSITVSENGKDNHFEIEHLSTISLSLRIKRNGEEI